MKIILICQAGTDMVWGSRYDAASFERAIETERGCSAVGGSVRRIDASAYRVYTGTSRACMQTAEILFERTGPIEATPLLDDVVRQRSLSSDYPLCVRLKALCSRADCRDGLRPWRAGRRDGAGGGRCGVRRTARP